MNRMARVERLTQRDRRSWSSSTWTASGWSRSAPACVLRPHARPARQARQLRPHGADQGRRRDRRAPHRGGHRDHPRRRRSSRRSATSPASAGSATRSCRWTRRSSRPPSTCPAAPTCVHHEPDGMAPLIGTYDTTLTRHIFESFASPRRICLHVRVIEGRNAAPHRGGASSRRWPGRCAPPRRRDPQARAAIPERPRAVLLGGSSLRGGGARLRVGQPPLGAARARAGRRRVEVTADPDAALDGDGLAVPGVGAFAACMAGLRAVGGDKLIGRRLAGRPPGARHLRRHAGAVRGGRRARRADRRAARAWPGTVERLRRRVLPHMGWNTVTRAAGLGAVRRDRPRARGSTSCTPTRCGTLGAEQLAAAGAPLITWAEHGEPFVAAVENGRAVRDPVPPGEVRRRRRRPAGQLAARDASS